MTAPIGNALPAGTYELEFQGTKLHGYTTDLGDDFQWRIASHEYDRVAGAQTEDMERGPWQLRVTLVFVDQSGFADATAFVQQLETKGRSGLLVHPIYGKRQATCLGTTGARIDAGSPNTYTMPVTFVENNLNGSIVAAKAQGVPSQSAGVTSQSANVLTLADPYG